MGKKRIGEVDEKRTKYVTHTRLYHPVVRKFSKREAQPILMEIRKRRKLDDPVRKALVNYMILRCETVFEHYFRSCVKQLADNPKYDVNLKFFFKKPSKKGSKGDQIISKYNFMDVKEVSFVMSKLLKTNFLKDIKNESIKYGPNYFYEYAHIKYTKPLHKNWNKFMSLFEKRDSITHENRLINMKYEDIRNFVGNIMQFMMCAEMYF